MDREAAQRALLKLAKQAASTWQQARGEMFRGDTTIETANTVYRFKDGVFSGRAPKPKTNEAPAWESPPSMTGIELIGFLANEDGLWSLSPRWKAGALAVMTTKVAAFNLTSPTFRCVIEAPARATLPPKPPPTVRRPAPPSMTRLQPAPPAPAER